MASDIGGHDHDDVLEIDRAALTISQTAIIQHLQQNIKYIVVRFLDLVEKDY